jgi:dTDP-4-dehydrorhamnose 3,5-epimerase
MIEGVIVKPLKIHADDRGHLMEILRDDDEAFEGFGQVYITTCYPGVVKAWHMHAIQTDHLVCVQGTMKVGLFDDRAESESCGQVMSVVLGVVHPALVRVPPRVWHGFTPLGNELAMLLNIPSVHYDYQHPDEMRRDPFDPEIPFEWITRGG